MKSFLILILLLLLNEFDSIEAQSTCPVSSSLTNTGSECRCGIKVDGNIYIYCARKYLLSLPLFTRSSILYDELILSGNQLSTIPNNAFRGLKVKRLYLDDNPIVNIEQEAFFELANYLEELIVSVSFNDQLANPAILGSAYRPQTPPKLFQSLLNLKVVKLTGVDFKSMPPSKYINENDDLSQITLRTNTFRRCRKLEVIHLNDAGIVDVEKNALAGVESSLRELSLDNNHITDINSLFTEIKRMRRLHTLILSRNRIHTIKDSSSQIISQTILNNQQQNLNDLLTNSNFHRNELYLDLSFNGISQIDPFSFGTTTEGIHSFMFINLFKFDLIFVFLYFSKDNNNNNHQWLISSTI
jgi:Leucine-rich repeat (LRR) protein